MKIKKFAWMIDKIETVRTHLKVNKSNFVRPFDMKPQSYNNFIGAQGSKPNIELVLGLVNHWGVDPNWLMDQNSSPVPVFLKKTQKQIIKEMLEQNLPGCSEQDVNLILDQVEHFRVNLLMDTSV